MRLVVQYSCCFTMPLLPLLPQSALNQRKLDGTQYTSDVKERDVPAAAAMLQVFIILLDESQH